MTHLKGLLCGWLLGEGIALFKYFGIAGGFYKLNAASKQNKRFLFDSIQAYGYTH